MELLEHVKESLELLELPMLRHSQSTELQVPGLGQQPIQELLVLMHIQVLLLDIQDNLLDIQDNLSVIQDPLLDLTQHMDIQVSDQAHMDPTIQWRACADSQDQLLRKKPQQMRRKPMMMLPRLYDNTYFD